MTYYVYLGPNIRGVIQHGKILPGDRAEVEAFLEEPIRKYPAIKRLLVSGDELAEARTKIKQPDSRLYEVYRRFVRELNKNGG